MKHACTVQGVGIVGVLSRCWFTAYFVSLCGWCVRVSLLPRHHFLFVAAHPKN